MYEILDRIYEPFIDSTSVECLLAKGWVEHSFQTYHEERNANVLVASMRGKLRDPCTVVFKGDGKKIKIRL